MKYKKLTGVVLKKQNYREADQIVTIWTQEAGKIRVLARSLRRSSSKLAYSLQDLSLCSIEVTGSKHLPTLINAKTVKIFLNLRQDLVKIGAGLYAAELMLKLTGDEHQNLPAYNVLLNFLETLDQDFSFGLIDKFSLDLMSALGFKAPEQVKSHREIKDFIESILEREIKSESFLTYA
jgi:DNA repair protein RecO (recombination protein O)